MVRETFGDSDGSSETVHVPSAITTDQAAGSAESGEVMFHRMTASAVPAFTGRKRDGIRLKKAGSRAARPDPRRAAGRLPRPGHSVTSSSWSCGVCLTGAANCAGSRSAYAERSKLVNVASGAAVTGE